MLLLINASRSVQFLFFYITSAKFRVNFQSQNSHHRASQISMSFRSPKSIFHFINTQQAQTSSGRLKKVTTSYDQTIRHQDVWKKTPDLRRLEDILFTWSWRRPIYDVLKTSDLQRLEDVWFTTSWRRPIYVTLKKSNLRRLKDVCKLTSWGRLIYGVFKTSDLQRLEDVQFTSSWRRPIYDVF